jgi:thiol-disulfide isomerase/thioredoxin
VSGRLAVVAGAVAGLTVGVIAVVAFVAAAPAPTAPPASTIALASSSPSAEPSLEPSPSPAPTASPSPPASASPTTFHIGEPAPPLVVAGLGEASIDLAKLRGKPVWVNFWGSYCPPCVDEFPLMNGYAAAHEAAGLTILAINVREDAATAEAFATDLNAIFTIGLDPDGETATAWDAIVLPVHYWIDAGGVIRAGAAGGIGPDIMEQGLATILPPSGSASPTSSPPSASSSSPSSSPGPSEGSPAASP